MSTSGAGIQYWNITEKLQKLLERARELWGENTARFSTARAGLHGYALLYT